METVLDFAKKVDIPDIAPEELKDFQYVEAQPKTVSPQPQRALIEGGGVNTNDETCVKQYFSYYAKLVNQQNMLQDKIRTGTYREGIFKNAADFKDKVVMDVGCGSGILSIFAAQAGAKKVYAVEASDMADCARTLVKHNKWDHVIEVIKMKIEDITEDIIPEKSVDCLVSEPLGTYLFNERMLETYVIARDKFMKPISRNMMFPCAADFCIIPMADEVLYNEVATKAEFW
jgi:histone-arginine methyltransferase CARM1